MQVQEIQQILRPRQPIDGIAIDIFSVGENHGSPYKYVIAAIDLMSRHVFTKNLQQATSENIATFLIEQVFVIKIPHKIISDNAENITGGALPHLYNSINLGLSNLKPNQTFKAATSSPYHSMGNAVIERFFRTFKQWLRKLVADEPELWHQYTGIITFQYNNTIHRGIGTSPNAVLFGIEPKDAKPDIFHILESGAQHSINSYMHKKAETIQKALNLAKKYAEQDSASTKGQI